MSALSPRQIGPAYVSGGEQSFRGERYRWERVGARSCVRKDGLT